MPSAPWRLSRSRVVRLRPVGQVRPARPTRPVTLAKRPAVQQGLAGPVQRASPVWETLRAFVFLVLSGACTGISYSPNRADRTTRVAHGHEPFHGFQHANAAAAYLGSPGRIKLHVERRRRPALPFGVSPPARQTTVWRTYAFRPFSTRLHEFAARIERGTESGHSLQTGGHRPIKWSASNGPRPPGATPYQKNPLMAGLVGVKRKINVRTRARVTVSESPCAMRLCGMVAFLKARSWVFLKARCNSQAGAPESTM